MNRQQLTHGLEFHDDGILDKQVESVANVDRQAVVLQRKDYFDGGPQAAFGQLVAQAGAIGAFEEAWAERRMNSDRSPHDLPRDFVQFHP